MSLPTSMAGLTAIGPNQAAMKVAGELPAAPPHTWPNNDQDVNNHRADGWGLVSMPEMEGYLNGLLHQIKVTTGTTDWPGAVHITAETSLNAGSSAAGNIYISLGWIQSAESEDEIFAILSHEYGHIYLNHYAAYDVSNAGDTSLLVASAAWSYVNRKVASSGWNGLDKLGVVQAVGTTVLMPAWQRSLEEQADLFGATVSIRCGYSYIHGFKAFLERIDTYDREAREEAEQLRQAQDKVIHEQIRQRTLAQIQKPAVNGPAAAAPVGASAPTAGSGLGQALAGLNDALAKLNSALAEGQVSLNQGTFDAGRTMDLVLANGMAALKDSHPEGAAREDDLSKEMAPLLTGKRMPAKTRPWESARKSGRTPVILAHYSLASKITAFQVRQQFPQELKAAREAASGPTANDAMLDVYLANAINDMRAPSKEDPNQILMRNLKSPERSWRLQVTVADQMLSRDPQKAQTFMEQQFEFFGKAPKLWPDMIAFYQMRGDNKQSKEMAAACAIALPDYRHACLDASQTPAEIAANKAKNDAHANVIVQNVKLKLSK